MYLTVRQLLNTTTMAGVEVIAGQAGLENKFIFITVLDCPDIADWMVGHELLVSNGHAIKDESPRRRSLIRDLSEKKVAALAIKRGRFLAEIPQYMIDDANTYGLPLLQLPYAMNWDVFVGPVDYWFFNPASDLIQLFIRGAGLPSICNKLQTIIQRPLAVTDIAFNLLGRSDDFDPALLEGGAAEEAVSEERLKRRYFIASYPRYRYSNSLLERQNRLADIFAIEHKGERHGYIVIYSGKDMPELSEYDIKTLELASITAPLEIVKQRDSRNECFQRWNGLLQNVLSGQIADEDELDARAGPLGLRMSGDYAVVLIGKGVERSGLHDPTGYNGSLLSSIYAIFARKAQGLLDYFNQAFVCLYEQRLVFLVPAIGGDSENARGVFDELRDMLVDFWALPELKLCAGGFYRPASLHKSYQEALCAVELSHLVSGNTVMHQRLGLLKMFIGPDGRVDEKAMDEIYCCSVKPLVEYDEASGGNLLETLNVYMRHDMQINSAAEALFLHKNTLRYRLERIEKLTGLSFDRVLDVVNFSLGLLVHHALQKTPPS